MFLTNRTLTVTLTPSTSLVGWWSFSRHCTSVLVGPAAVRR